MAIDPRKLRGPAAAFTMAILLAAYVRTSMQRARFESKTRQRSDLHMAAENLKKVVPPSL